GRLRGAGGSQRQSPSHGARVPWHIHEPDGVSPAPRGGAGGGGRPGPGNGPRLPRTWAGLHGCWFLLQGEVPASRGARSLPKPQGAGGSSRPASVRGEGEAPTARHRRGARVRGLG